MAFAPQRRSVHEARRPPPDRRILTRLLGTIAWALLIAQVAWAQAPAPQATDDGVREVTVEEIPAIAAFGVVVGFPAYRTVSLSASIQAEFLGAAVRVGYGTVGFAGGVQARAYPPVPWPVPTFVGVGADIYDGRIAPHVAVGAHVPIAERWRVDVEGGVAWTPLVDTYQVAPFLTFGASYAFATDLPASTPRADDEPTGPAPARIAAGCPATEPDPSSLRRAVGATVDRFVADATATYGSVYRNLRYRTSIDDIDVDGARATVRVDYDGSVVERLNGRTHDASGTAEIDFRWNGCGWTRTGLRY